MARITHLNDNHRGADGLELNADDLGIDAIPGLSATDIQGALEEIGYGPAFTVTVSMTNKSGGTVNNGDLVIINSAISDSFTTTTSAAIETSIGVAQETISNNASGQVATSGYVGTLNTNGVSVTAGDYLFHAGAAKYATGNATRGAGAFAQSWSTTSNPDAWLWGVADQTAGTAAHIADATDAHDASAISVLDTAGNFTGTDVETVLDEIWDGITAGGIPATIVDAKGDLIAATAADTVARLAVGGTDGHVLTVDAAEATGMKWAVGGGALTDHTHAVTGSGATGGGATLNVPTLNGTGLVKFSTTLTSTVNADQNDFAPASIHAAASIRFTSFSANRTITGIDAGANGEVLILQNNTSFSLLLTNESASSAAANRFRSPNAATHTVRQQGSVLLVYLGGRWCVIAA